MTGTAPRRRVHLLAAGACAGIALMMGWLTVTGSRYLSVPPAVAFAVACVFAAASARLVQMIVRPGSAGDGFAALILTAMAGIGGWIAVGPGTRVCTAGLPGQAPAAMADMGCRVPFGIGALITGMLAGYCAWLWLGSRRLAGSSDKSAI